jgi:hypothetical protein
MGRPLKEARLRMSVDLRIPVTAEQKRMIAEAAAIAQSDMAAWVRPLLVQAAEKRIASSRQANKPASKRKTKGGTRDGRQRRGR